MSEGILPCDDLSSMVLAPSGCTSFATPSFCQRAIWLVGKSQWRSRRRGGH
ncbi:uncharacterized protein CTRU02_208508 [Colletotrichum truncatum]|uniref:Uncharacterized protein n=1 Tax=Colletotrichum truncatum TaxID=5467 RepID=A0ACC3YWH7_COLTU|nr:uncharacterized protein CTRU02_10263 [Colletotrichum truncatum]KAF6787467.1 hypothetical protein CTRU02_10263 [Colletotrichum truncatum]